MRWSTWHRDRILAALIQAGHWRNAALALPGAFDALKDPGIRFDHPATFA